MQNKKQEYKRNNKPRQGGLKILPYKRFSHQLITFDCFHFALSLREHLHRHRKGVYGRVAAGHGIHAHPNHSRYPPFPDTAEHDEIRHY